MSELSEQAPFLPTPGAMYFNSFARGVGSIDLSVVIQLNQAPQLELKMTYNNAKGLAEAMTEAVKTFEELSRTKVMTGAELTKIVGDSAKAKKSS